MNPDILLHDHTRKALDTIMSTTPHAVLLTADAGAGKETVAIHLAQQLLQTDNLEAVPYFSFIRPQDKTLTINQIRDLHKFMQLKTAGTAKIRRIAILEQADYMNDEAQNALLKLLEEPPLDTVIIMLASQPQRLRPTIHSRVQSVLVHPISEKHAQKHFKQKGMSDQEINRAHALSNGMAGLMYALLAGDNSHHLLTHIEMAKRLYGLSPYERLLEVENISKDKDTVTGLLFAAKRICLATLHSGAKREDEGLISAWHRQLKLITEAELMLRHHPNTKLLLTDLFLQM